MATEKYHTEAHDAYFKYTHYCDACRGWVCTIVVSRTGQGNLLYDEADQAIPKPYFGNYGEGVKVSVCGKCAYDAQVHQEVQGLLEKHQTPFERIADTRRALQERLDYEHMMCQPFLYIGQNGVDEILQQYPGYDPRRDNFYSYLVSRGMSSMQELVSRYRARIV